MKKLLLIAIVGLGVMATSCKKDFTCDCESVSKVEYEDGWGDEFDDLEFTSSSSQTQKLSKRDAEEWCGNINATTTSSDIFSSTTITTTCDLR